MDVTPFLQIEAAPRVLARQAEVFGDATRFQVRTADGGWRPVSWRDFAAQVRHVALDLRDQGLQAGDRAGALGALQTYCGLAEGRETDAVKLNAAKAMLRRLQSEGASAR